MKFQFSFTGPDIEGNPRLEDAKVPSLAPPYQSSEQVPEKGLDKNAVTSAFPVKGKDSLPPKRHTLEDLVGGLPGRIAYACVGIELDGDAKEQVKSKVWLPRRELWDVRVQVLREMDSESATKDGRVGEGLEGSGREVGLGKEDVKTGVYEGGFKSWESSADLIKVLAERFRDVDAIPDTEKCRDTKKRRRIMELGCGTALPTLSVLRWFLEKPNAGEGLQLIFADYNAAVLELVTLPNLLLLWCMVDCGRKGETWETEGEVDVSGELVDEFLGDLKKRGVKTGWLSGAWGREFVALIQDELECAGLVNGGEKVEVETLLIGAETIYSPMALEAFAETVAGILWLDFGNGDGNRHVAERGHTIALVAAKTVYFGVGGTMEDFCERIRALGREKLKVVRMRDESVGVRREVVEVRWRE